MDTISHTLPNISLKILKDSINHGRGPISMNSFEQLLLGMIRHVSPSEIASWMDVEEGLENRIKRYALECTSIEDFSIKKPRPKDILTQGPQRILIHGLLRMKTEDVINLVSRMVLAILEYWVLIPKLLLY